MFTPLCHILSFSKVSLFVSNVDVFGIFLGQEITEFLAGLVDTTTQIPVGVTSGVTAARVVEGSSSDLGG